MKKLLILFIAVLLNAFGQSLMAQTDFGMTAWGMAAINTENLFNISLGMSFIVLSICAYFVGTAIRRKFILREMIESFIFLFAFGGFTDLFVYLIPDLSAINVALRVLFNVFGLLILLFSISLHLKVGIAIHPMDVYLREIQKKVKSISKGTYISYGSAFLIGTVFGLIYGEIGGIHIGTIYTLLLSGLIFDFYTNKLLKNINFN